MKSEIDLFVIKEIRRRRKELGYSQRYLADCLNLSRSFIGNIENPKRASKYKIEHLNEIAKILKCSIKDFFPDNPL